MHVKFGALLLFALSFNGLARAEVIEPNLLAKEILSERAAAITAAGKKGLVVVFLSAHCPCSHSHLTALKKLSAEFPDFSFVGVHANTDETKVASQEYFKQAALPFPVLQDTGAKIGDRFHALKTPHAFVLSNAGEVLYKGGVSDSRDFAKAKHHYLAEALADIQAGKALRASATRTLGCTIARGGKDDW